MTTTFDLNLLPIARYAGRDYPELLGLLSSEPGRRTARGRNLDRLILYFIAEGNAPLPPEKRDQVLADLAKLYYQTPGSVTAALRRTVDELNRMILERNLSLGPSRQGIGHLIQVVLREDRLTIAQTGLLQAFLVSASGVQRFENNELSGRGLGIAKAGPVCFSQASLQPNDTLLMTTKPLSEWSPEVLSSIHGQGPESLRRRLFYQTSSDLNAVAIQAKQGKGKTLLLWSGASQPAPSGEKKDGGAQETPPPAVVAPEPDRTTPSQPAADTASLAPGALPAAAAAVAIGTAAAVQAQAASEASSPQAVAASTPPSSQAIVAPTSTPVAPDSASEAQLLPEKPTRKAKSAGAGGFFAGVGAALAGAWRKLGSGLRLLIGRMLPEDAFMNVSSGVMALIAIAVPVVIVTAASVVYLRLGRSAQYELLSTQAQQVAMQAMEQTDLGQKRASLGSALSLLQRAESYATTSETQAEIGSLRVQVRQALDELDYVRRVSYQSAIVGGLPPNSKIVAMTAFEDELFMLDETSGSVVRAFLTNQGYEVDYTFQCGPGTYGEIKVSSIIEIIAWPVGYKPAASLLAVDSGGSVLYCQADRAPIAERLTSGEGESWGNILEATLDQGDFYALDLPSNGVWIYWRGNFGEQPTLFFDEQIPPLKDVIDMLVDRDDLYLLQLDGSMMLCARDTLVVAPTRCSFQPFMDRRPGRENLPLVPSSAFIQILSTPPPDPSIYMLEPQGQAVYHFSLRNLAFQKQLLARDPLPGRPATAFTINNNLRYIYLALENQVFYAPIP